MTKSVKNKLLECIYLICISAYFIVSLGAYSPFGDSISQSITQKDLFTYSNWIIFSILAVIYIFKEHTDKKEILMELFVAAVFFIATFTNQTVTNKYSLTQWTFFFTTGMFIICATVTTFKRIAIATLAPNIFMFIAFNIIDIYELIPEFMAEPYILTGRMAHYMGYYYYSHPSYYMLFAWAIYMFLRGKKKIGWIELGIELVAQYQIYRYTTCRLGFLCALVLFILYVVIVKLDLINFNWKITKFASISGFSLAALFTLLSGYLYTPSISIIQKINSALSGRLKLINLAFERYNIKLFGRIILPPADGSYFYLDSGYVYALFGCGLIFFLVVLAMHSYALYYAYKTNNKPLFVWIVALLVFNIIGDAWVAMTYSPVVLGFFIFLREHRTLKKQQL